jgi:hypothetical protein
MNILHFIHYLIPISILLIPLLPNKYLIKVIFVPALLQLTWLLCDGCFLSKITKNEINNKHNNFILHLFNKYINKNITLQQSSRFVNLIISTIILISAYKLLYNCEKTNQ